MKRLAIATLAGSSMFICGTGMASDDTSSVDDTSPVFRKWMASCNQQQRCEAATGNKGPGTSGNDVSLVIERRRDEKRGWLVGVDFSGADAPEDGSISLSVPRFPGLNYAVRTDFHIIDDDDRVYLSNADAIEMALPAFLAGDDLIITVNSADARPVSYEMSLLGLRASIGWIEKQLDIVDSPRTAVAPASVQTAAKPEPVATGDKPAATGDVPAAAGDEPAATGDEPTATGDESTAAEREAAATENEPAETESEPAATVVAGIPDAVRALHGKMGDCTEFSDDDLQDLGLVTIEPDARTRLHVVPCSRAAYNVTFRLYAQETEAASSVRTLLFATYSNDTNWSGTDVLFNVTADGKELSSLYKGRGLGDCGTTGKWTWQGYDYKLEHYASQEDCEGIKPEDWPQVFPVKSSQ